MVDRTYYGLQFIRKMNFGDINPRRVYFGNTLVFENTPTRIPVYGDVRTTVSATVSPTAWDFGSGRSGSRSRTISVSGVSLPSNASNISMTVSGTATLDSATALHDVEYTWGTSVNRFGRAENHFGTVSHNNSEDLSSTVSITAVPSSFVVAARHNTGNFTEDYGDISGLTVSIAYTARGIVRYNEVYDPN